MLEQLILDLKINHDFLDYRYRKKYNKYIYIENLAYLINIAIKNYYYKPIVDYNNITLLYMNDMIDIFNLSI